MFSDGSSGQTSYCIVIIPGDFSHTGRIMTCGRDLHPLALTRCVGAPSARWTRVQCAQYAPGNISFRCVTDLYRTSHQCVCSMYVRASIRMRTYTNAPQPVSISVDVLMDFTTKTKFVILSARMRDARTHPDRGARGRCGCRRGDAFCVVDSLLDWWCHITTALDYNCRYLTFTKSRTTITQFYCDFSIRILMCW